MQIREVSIRNFRCVEQLLWRPIASFVCLIGRGDVGKSTVLDAIELALSPRTPAVTDTDFVDADTSKEIAIDVTVGELSEQALEDYRFGLHLRGWQKTGVLRDEPQGDDEPVVTVRVTFDASLEGDWTLHTDRQDPRQLSPRDRAVFGLVRLGAETEKHLKWGRYAPLSSATEDHDSAFTTLAEAFRLAREHVVANGLPMLANIAATVTGEAKRLGAYCATSYSAGLDTQRTATSLSGISLHDGAVPVRLTGLGTRRLVSLAIQRMSVKAGAIVLIDEIEHGLEPHRIRHALKVLRDSVDPENPGDKGQVFLTTHSPTTLVELAHQQVVICRNASRKVTMQTPGKDLQGLLRRIPEALLAQRVLTCEGPTEVGLIRGLRDTWSTGRLFPFEAQGTWLADGRGSEGPATALELASLGYATALFRDSDVLLAADVQTKLATAGVKIYEWAGGLATEQRIFSDVSWVGAQRLLDIAYTAHTESSILSQVANALGVPKLPGVTIGDWSAAVGKTDVEIREALGNAAHKRAWYKNTTFGELLGEALGAEIRAATSTPLAQLLGMVEAWLYA